MESKREFTSDTDKDETLVTPRFDSGEAETAQPVVPLAVVSGEAETYGAPAYDGAGAPFVAPRSARRASWPLALVLVSALAGSVLGGAGLYLFQKSRQQRGAPAAQIEQTTGANDAAGQTPAAEPVSEAPAAAPPAPEETGALAAELPAEVAEVPVVAEVSDAKEDRKDKEDADDKRDEPKRDKDEDDARPARAPAAVAEKRGKKGERDDNEARESRPRRVENDSPDREEYYDRGGARRIGTIVYEREARRERRRQRRQPAVDRVRGIFEGQP